MDFSLAILLGSFAGGLFGAAIGGLPAFIFTGFMVLAGTGVALSGSEFDFITNIAFGPVFGPHIAFAGGVAGAAYANRRGLLENGKNINAPLVGLNDPSVLLVGGAFGLGGHMVQQLIDAGIGSYTDAVAMVVFISGVTARLIFGKCGLTGSLTPEARARGWHVPGGEQIWAAYQQGFVQASVLGSGAGLLSGWMVTAFAEISTDYVQVGTVGVVLGFGISAATLILLQIGYDCPITHHMTLPGAVAATTILAVGGAPGLAVLAGGAFGLLGALVGELASRLFLIHGDTHVDPPAFAIFVLTSVAIIGGLPFGA